MPVNLSAPNPADLLPIAGLRLGIAQAGVRKANRNDLTVMLLEAGADVAAVFTQNRFCAAPVVLGKAHLARGMDVRALVINTGNANAGTGDEGMSRAMATCIAMAQQLDIAPEQVLPFSTGVIMEQLPSERIIAALPAAIAHADGAASGERWAQAAQAIMTTDTVAKAFSRRVQLGGSTVNVTGISKGAGMIRPNMATMLGFVATDARVAPGLLQTLAKELADQSFNRITVDGDTSTNDSFVVIATNQGAHPVISSWSSPDGVALKAALLAVAQSLAQAIVRDGEGATKFITVNCTQAKSEAEALKVCYAIAHSPLVKTALYASDPNLGRILAAVGYSGIADLDAQTIGLHIGHVHVVKDGARLASYVEAEAAKVMAESDIAITVSLGRGEVEQTLWTCDFSEAYVKINADYRS